MKSLPDGPDNYFIRRALTDPQKRVLAILRRATGPMSRSMIHAVCVKYGIGAKLPAQICEAVGRSDSGKRYKFEQSKAGGCGRRPSLLTLGYISETKYDIDGISELGLSITELGKLAIDDIEELRRKRNMAPILPENPIDEADDSDALPAYMG